MNHLANAVLKVWWQFCKLALRPCDDCLVNFGRGEKRPARDEFDLQSRLVLSKIPPASGILQLRPLRKVALQSTSMFETRDFIGKLVGEPESLPSFVALVVGWMQSPPE